MLSKLVFINFLTFIRVIGTIVIIPIYRIYGGVSAGLVSLFCYFTDSLDGILARRWKASTFFGALFDGIADKMLTIANFILLYLITPYALVAIVFELLVIIVQILKFNKNMNVKSNVIGKLKVWLLAICVVLILLISDATNIPLIGLEIKSIINGIVLDKLYFWILFPALIMEALTLLSYLLEIFSPKNVQVLSSEVIKIDDQKINYKNNWDKFKNICLSPDYYQKHKDDQNLHELYKYYFSKEKINQTEKI